LLKSAQNIEKKLFFRRFGLQPDFTIELSPFDAVSHSLLRIPPKINSYSFFGDILECLQLLFFLKYIFESVFLLPVKKDIIG